MRKLTHMFSTSSRSKGLTIIIHSFTMFWSCRNISDIMFNQYLVTLLLIVAL